MRLLQKRRGILVDSGGTVNAGARVPRHSGESRNPFCFDPVITMGPGFRRDDDAFARRSLAA
jgi:hypothetical protein